MGPDESGHDKRVKLGATALWETFLLQRRFLGAAKRDLQREQRLKQTQSSQPGCLVSDSLIPTLDRLITVEEAARVKSLTSAVQYAHSQGILHRDLNPRNVLLVPEPTLPESSSPREFPFIVKLSDFGLGTWLNSDQNAVQTQTGTVVGTIPYMAPEQTQGTTRFLQPTVDVHGLGVMLYELLSQTRPYIGTTPLETLRLINENPPPPLRKGRLGVPRDLETICLKRQAVARAQNKRASLNHLA